MAVWQGSPQPLMEWFLLVYPTYSLSCTFFNEDVGKGKPSPWSSGVWGCGISQDLLVDNHETPERDSDHKQYVMACKRRVKVKTPFFVNISFDTVL